MPNLLLELFSEEIPARMQRTASETMRAEFTKALAAARLTHGKIISYFTPRRIAFIINDLPNSQPDNEVERKGPATNAPVAAIEGFLRSTGVTKEECEVRLVGKQECYFAVIKEHGKPTSEALVPIINHIITGYTWPKSMRWGAYECSYVRPLQNICCLLNEEIIPVNFAHIKANNQTFGHRFMAPEPITLHSPDEYEAALEKAFVIADAERRKHIIIDTITSSATAQGLEIVEDTALLEEVTGLVEWPVILQGRIGDNYMDLPPEVLRSEMRNHQKYFNLRKPGAEGISAEFFIVSNLIASDQGKAIIAGNERVLRARLADGRFYWDQDRKKSLSDWGGGLENMVFHAKIGTMAQKVQRIIALSELLATYVPDASVESVKRAAQLCKADLVSGMVGEFPELQGVMGRYYAIAQNEPLEIANAIRDHYAPLGPSAPCPTEPVSITIALADKLDSLISLFAVGEKPTGSKDPFALRRAALGCIRLILENNLRIPLKKFLNEELISFFADRLKIMLKEQGYRHDLVNAVFTAQEDDIIRIVQRVDALSRFLETDDGFNLLAAYKRAANILRIEEKKDNIKYDTVPEAALFTVDAEVILHSALQKISAELPDLLKNENYQAIMLTLATLRSPLDSFFDKATVNDEEATLRKNRLSLLGSITQLMESIADFSKIEG